MEVTKIVIDTALSLVAIILSVWVFIYSKKSNRTTFEIGVYQMIQNSKINLDNFLYSTLNDKMDADDFETSSKAFMETYLDSLNSACSLYWLKDINQKRFLAMYSQDIKNIFERAEVFGHVLKPQENTFCYLRKVYNQIQNGEGK